MGLSVHPDEIPELLLRVKLGTRYQVALVQIGEDEEPTLPEALLRETTPGVKAVAAAGQLCRSGEFQTWIMAGDTHPEPEAEAARRLRVLLGVASRSELAVNEAAVCALDQIIRQWKGDLGIEL